jgi:hypothetical protein
VYMLSVHSDLAEPPNRTETIHSNMHMQSFHKFELLQVDLAANPNATMPALPIGNVLTHRVVATQPIVLGFFKTTGTFRRSALPV